MRLPNLNDLIEEQMVVYEHAPDQSLFVAGPPGSGKTSLAILRANFLKNTGQQVCLVTKNRMLKRLASQLGGGDIRTETMHRFVTTAYSRTIGGNTPQEPAYEFDWDKIIAAYTAAGYAPSLDHLVIDEGQNLPRGFFQWAVRFGARTVTVFADEDQTTDPQRLSSSLADIVNAGLPEPRRLHENHRNTAEIAAVAEHFHRSSLLPPGVVRRGRGGETPKLVNIDSWGTAAMMIAARYRNRGESIGVIVYLKDDVRTLKDLLSVALPDARVDSYTSSSPEGSEDINMLSPGVTVLSSESVIGLEFDAGYLQDLKRSLPCNLPEQFRRLYMLCARARNSLTLLNGPDSLSPAELASLPGPILLER